MSGRPPTLEEALAALRQHRDVLASNGVRHAAVFGSVARREANDTSDLDVLVELDAADAMTAFDYARIKRLIAELFTSRVDVVNRAFLKPHLAQSTADSAVYAF